MTTATPTADSILLNHDGSLSLERHWVRSFTKFQNPVQVCQKLRLEITLPAGFEWKDGMGRPAVKAIAKVASPDGTILCSQEILEAAIVAARKAKENKVAGFLEAQK